MNCAERDTICNEHKISSYPTLVLFPGEHVLNGAQSAVSVLSWVRKTHPSESQLSKPDAGEAVGAVVQNPHLRLANSSLDVHELVKAAKLASLGLPTEARYVHDGLLADGTRGAPSPHASGLATTHAELQRPDGGAPSLRLRKMSHPIPAVDVLAAARWTLLHDVTAVLSATPSQAFARKPLGALRAWLHLLSRGLPRDRDGGTAANGAAELLTALHGEVHLPTSEEWRAMLVKANVEFWPSEWHACNSSHPELHAYPCSLWLLFHSLLAHQTEPDALPSLHAIVGYVTNFFSCKDCVGHFAVLAAGLEGELRAMASTHQHGRERAALWLWQAHNKVSG